jgi:mutator protein MutT
LTEQQYVAHGFVIRNGQYLLTRRGRDRYWGGLWDIPGGTVEVGETPENAAVRECMEEVGLSTSVWDLVSHLENLDTHGRDIKFHTLTFVLAELGDAEPVALSHEHKAHCWVGVEEALSLPLVWHVRENLITLQNRA